MQAHIASEVGHYKGKCYAWDVVNEAFNDDGSLVSCPFTQYIGAAYIPLAFQAAGQADPNAQLYYNDYNIETAGAKLNAALALVPKIRAIGARIDAIGFESHFIVGSTPSASALTSAMNSVTALNLNVAVTELDIRFSSLPPSSSGLTQQANDYTGVVQACLNVARCVGVTVWDFDDNYSWIPGTFSGAGDADLYWANLTVKPAYNSIVNLLKAHATSSTSAAPSSTMITVTTTSPAGSPTPTTTTTTTPVTTPAPTTTMTTTTAGDSGGSQTHWGQCGGIGWSGPSGCAAPYACETQNAYYAQCL
jgi:endo-1,4-beta-xylanase